MLRVLGLHVVYIFLFEYVCVCGCVRFARCKLRWAVITLGEKGGADRLKSVQTLPGSGHLGHRPAVSGNRAPFHHRRGGSTVY